MNKTKYQTKPLIRLYTLYNYESCYVSLLCTERKMNCSTLPIHILKTAWRNLDVESDPDLKRRFEWKKGKFSQFSQFKPIYCLFNRFNCTIFCNHQVIQQTLRDCIFPPSLLRSHSMIQSLGWILKFPSFLVLKNFHYSHLMKHITP